MEHTLNKFLFIILPNLTCFFFGKKIVISYLYTWYLTKLSDHNEKNSIFGNFVSECFSILVCIMHKLGHCGGDERLKNIIARHPEIREYFGHEEVDAGSHIIDFNRRTGLKGKQ